MVASASTENLQLMQELAAQLWATEIKHKQEFHIYYDVMNGKGIHKNLHGRQMALNSRTLTHTPVISGSLSPRHGVSSGCEWRNGLQYGE
jgi:hypothetical protein